MYQALLTRRYLTSKVMPLLAMLAVALCTAMVLVVWSVMGGFLSMLLASGRTLMGDVLITRPMPGIPLYAGLIERLEADPSVAAATPIIETPGLLNVPAAGLTLMVQAVGVEGESYAQVTGFDGALWWRRLEEPLPKDKGREDPRLSTDPRTADALDLLQRAGAALTIEDPETGAPAAAAVLGIEAGGLTRRVLEGWYQPSNLLILGEDSVTLGVPTISQRGAPVDFRSQRFPVANQFRTGLYEVDARTVLVRLDALQELVGMEEAVRVRTPQGDAPGFGVQTGPDGRETFVEPEVVGVEPARVTSVLVRGAPGVTPAQLRPRCEAIYAAFAAEHAGDVPPLERVEILTWEERPNIATFVAAVKKETALVLFIFGFISLTAVFLVFAIFWSMVSEKTKDVGVLRAIGASRSGVAWLFLRYGLAIGVAGAAGGTALAYAVVWNINPIHDWLGRALGIVVWDPRVYYFSRIPAQVVPGRAGLVFGAGVLVSVLGALVPALKAAFMDPVRALRFE